MLNEKYSQSYVFPIFPITEVVQERKATFKEDAKEEDAKEEGPKFFSFSYQHLCEKSIDVKNPCKDIFM